MTKITFGELTQTQKLEAADLMQKLEAINAALATVNDERITVIATYNQKQFALEGEREKVRKQLQAIRVAKLEA